jgi:hypothetical protein
MDVTMNSSVMDELFDACVRTSRNGQIVQLIVPKDSIETVGFAHRVAERIERDLYLTVVDEEDDLDSIRDNLTIEYAVVILHPRKVSPALWQALAEAPPGLQRMLIMCFGSERECAEVLSSFPEDLIERLDGPQPWPSLTQREPDLDGVIDVIMSRLRDAESDPQLDPATREEIRRRRDGSTGQVYANLRKAFETARKLQSAWIIPAHLRAAKRPDVRESLRRDGGRTST